MALRRDVSPIKVAILLKGIVAFNTLSNTLLFVEIYLKLQISLSSIFIFFPNVRSIKIFNF